MHFGKTAAVTAMLVWQAASAAGQAGSPAGPVPPQLLAHRRAALAQRIGNGVAVLRSAALRSVEGDYPQDSDFRQDNDFFYLTGLETADSWLVLVARNGSAEVRLYLPPRDAAAEQWTGATVGPGAEAARLTGISDVRNATRFETEFGALAGGDVYLGEPPAARRTCARAADARLACIFEHLLGRKPAGAGRLRPLAPHLAALRLVKDEEEIRRLRRSIEITAEAQRAAMQAIVAGVWEYEIEALIEYTFRRRGAERVGFPSIIGSGPNSTVLHYDKNRRRTVAGDLVVMDVGAEFGYYTADVTRTVPVSGRFTSRQRALYDLVLGAQQAALAAVRPGVTMAELNRVAREYMRSNSAQLCAPGSCERHFVHGLGHWLGMDVHDVGSYNTPLVAGMVLTIEPGIYIPGEDLGIRIEDDVLVTATGYELLSGGAPRTPADIETLMSRAR